MKNSFAIFDLMLRMNVLRPTSSFSQQLLRIPALSFYSVHTMGRKT
jgi:hypothetical protein